MTSNRFPNNLLYQFLLYVTVTSFLSGCAYFNNHSENESRPPRKSPTQEFIQQVKNDIRPISEATVNQQITDSLMTEYRKSDKRSNRKDSTPLDISAKNLDAKTFFRSLMLQSQHNIIVSDGVSGAITLNLKNVTLDEIFSLVRVMYGYSISLIGNTYFIQKPELTTRVFELNYVNLVRRSASFTQVNSGQVGSPNNRNNNNNNGNNNAVVNGQNDQGSAMTSGTQIRTEQINEVWKEIEKTLKTITGEKSGRRIIVSPNTNLVIVKAMPNELAQIENFLSRAELGLQRQVILEAKILEVSLDESFQSGINWETLADVNSGSLLRVATSGNSLLDPAQMGGAFQFSYEGTDFDGVIELLETQGDVKVLSSPRVSTVNNQKAVIKVGQDEFFVTDISTTTVAGTATTTTPEVTLTPFFSGIALDVTPQISGNDSVILHVHPAISEVQDQTKRLQVAGEELTLPLALNSIRETDSIVKARNGQVIVIGGLMQNRVETQNQGLPILGSIPIIGRLFSQQREIARKSELIILIKPTIASQEKHRRLIDDVITRAQHFESR